MRKCKRRNFGERKSSSAVPSNTDLEELVFKVFLKHVKSNNLYIPFRWSVNINGKDKDIIHVLSSNLCHGTYHNSKDRIARIGCAFSMSRSISDIISTLRLENRYVKIENTSKFQIALMNMVNMLIHNCIEHAVHENIKLLEKIGSDVFEEVGKKLFGEDFKDITEEALDPSQREFMNKMQIMRSLPSREEMARYLRLMHEKMRQEGNFGFSDTQPIPFEMDLETRGRIPSNHWDVDYDFEDEWV